jgi:hypothetical protein
VALALAIELSFKLLRLKCHDDSADSESDGGQDHRVLPGPGRPGQRLGLTEPGPGPGPAANHDDWDSRFTAGPA